jgi:hypothetical protein
MRIILRSGTASKPKYLNAEADNMRMIDRHYCMYTVFSTDKSMYAYFLDIGRAINHLADYAVHIFTIYSVTIRNLLATFTVTNM